MSTSTSRSPLLKLPRELRDAIFERAFYDTNLREIDFSAWYHARNGNTLLPESDVWPPYFALPALCQTSKQLYWEATPLFIETISIMSQTPETTSWLQKWLSTFLDGSGFSAVQHLAFRSFLEEQQSKGYNLIALCPRLKSLHMMLGEEEDLSQGKGSPHFEPSPLSKSVQKVPEGGPKPKQQDIRINLHEMGVGDVIKKYELERVVDIPSLGKFTFGFHDWILPLYLGIPSKLEKWLRAQFEKRGRVVEAESTHHKLDECSKDCGCGHLNDSTD